MSIKKYDVDPISLTVYGSAVLAIISFFLPWIDAGLMGSKNAFHSDNITVLLEIVSWIPAIYTSITKKLVFENGVYIIKLLINLTWGPIAVISAIYIIFFQASVSTPLGSVNLAGIGAYLFLLSAVVLSFCNFIFFKKYI